MNFEEALREELNSIVELSNKVYPLRAKEGTVAPYLIYVKNNLDYVKTFDGTSNCIEARYEVNVICDTYANLQPLYKKVKDKLLSFQGRTIGTLGPRIENISIENVADLYEREVGLYRTYIELKIYFKEE